MSLAADRDSRRRVALLKALATVLEDRDDVERPDLHFVRLEFRVNPRNGDLANLRLEVVTESDLPGRRSV